MPSAGQARVPPWPASAIFPRRPALKRGARLQAVSTNGISTEAHEGR